MCRGGTLAAVISSLAVVLAMGGCSSAFDREPDPAPDAGPAPGPRFRLVVDPSLVILEAGGSADITVVAEELPPTDSIPTAVQMTGLPEGVTASGSLVARTIHLQAALGSEGVSSFVKVTSSVAGKSGEVFLGEASFEVRTITKTAPVLDPTYGDSGRAFVGGGLSRDEPRGVVIQPDGKVIVAGGYNTGYTRVPAIARYGTNGALDPSFGNAGVAILSDHTNSFAVAVALQADGKVLVMEPFDFSVTRLTTAGAVDPQFGSGGIAFAQWNADSLGTAMVVQSDGKIVVGGDVAGTGFDFAVARYTTTGALDTTWNGTGRTSTSVVSFDDAVTALALDTDGSVIAAGTAIVGGRTQVALARFGATGAVSGTTTYSSNASADDVASTVAIANGKVLVAGSHREAPATDLGFVLRYGSNLALDPTFDGDGVRTFDLGGDVAIESLVVQANGALVFGGAVRTAPAAPGKIALARLTSDGAFDATFGAAGIVTTAAGDGSSVRKLTLDANGKIVAAGVKRVAADPDVVVARYDANGTLDSTWGTAGLVAMPFGPGDDGIRAAAFASDGKLVVAGYAYNGSDFDFLVARLLPDGKLDPSFGNGTGRILFDRPGTSQFAYGLVVQADKKILVSGQGGPGTIVLRLNEDGSLDPSFGTQGVTTIAAGDAFGLAVRDVDGRFTVAGSAPGSGFFVARLTPTGVLDSTYGQGGVVTTQFDIDARGIAFALDPTSSKVVVVGHVDFKKPPNFFDLAVARFEANGALDTAFDGDGKTTINTSDVELFYTTALQADGKVVVAGRASSQNEGSSFAVFRLDASGALDTSFGNNGRASLSVGAGSQASQLVVQPNGTILAGGRTADNGIALALLTAKGASAWPGGAVKTPVGSGGEAFAVARENSSTSGKRIVAAGYARVRTDEDGIVLRYQR